MRTVRNRSYAVGSAVPSSQCTEPSVRKKITTPPQLCQLCLIYDQIGHGNTYEGEAFLYTGKPRPTSQGARPQRSPVLGVPSIYAYTRCTKLGVVTHMERGVFQRFSPATPFRLQKCVARFGSWASC